MAYDRDVEVDENGNIPDLPTMNFLLADDDAMEAERLVAEAEAGEVDKSDFR